MDRADPVDPVRLTATGDAALQNRDYAATVAAFEQVVPLRPDDVRVLLNLGGALKELGRFEEALGFLRRAVSLDPARHAAWSNIGTVCLELQRYDDAIAAFSNALRLKPDHGPALSGLGVTLRRRGLPIEALGLLDLAIAASPDDADLRTARSFAYLAAGDYRKGFAEYEWRLHTRIFSDGLPKGPSWKGEPLAGRTLLLHGEGGLGDILQFCRFIPLLHALDCRLVMQVPQPLVRLMSRIFGIPVLADAAALPPYDLFCSLMSLPYVLGMTIDTVPCAGGYLVADPDIVARWQTVLDRDAADRHPGPGSHRPPLKVGLVWSGGRRPWHLENLLMDSRRSTSLSALAPLARCADDAVFYSLQLGEAAAEITDPAGALPIIDHTALIRDFDDTAGLVSLLDLVIAVDTSTAHLAAALGRPVWLLSRYDQCWRWLPGRTDTPWYRSMRIHTQPAPFDWGSPIAKVTADLLDWSIDPLPRRGREAS
ncbi:tetratricopeptide repeat protein [Lichenicola sp.]|uniref:tetratricopeptide repeat protein n=1 Tax=Lichenicola sp. TaxID=2804529 RepID=UPI003B00FD21